MRSGTPISILVLCFLYFLPTAIAKKGNVPKAFASMPPSSIKHEDSAVLKELKDTIKKQAAEIDALRKGFQVMNLEDFLSGLPKWI